MSDKLDPRQREAKLLSAMRARAGRCKDVFWVYYNLLNPYAIKIYQCTPGFIERLSAENKEHMIGPFKWKRDARSCALTNINEAIEHLKQSKYKLTLPASKFDEIKQGAPKWQQYTRELTK